MGQLDLDLSKSKLFSAGIYTAAAVGAVASAVTFGTGTALSALAYGALGAVAGGIGVPVALTAVAVVGYAGYIGLAAAAKALKKEGTMVPLGMAVAGVSAAKALLVNPVLGVHKLVKSILPKQDGDAKPAAPAAPQSAAPQEKASSFFQKVKLKWPFQKALDRKEAPAPKAAPQPKNTPKNTNAPKPPSA